ncbi:MAG: AAA family ATPase [Anaerotruncus rubiinfantis]
MIPVSITFEAFGPYVEKQQVDFGRFMPGGLVLIHGETGAGKTVILDAMTYALYGRSSGGARGDLAAMRCLTAPDSAVTRVEYIFDLRGRRYRFARSLKVRKKRSGALEYLPEQQAWFLDGEGNFAPFFENPRLRDVEGKAQELIGLSYEQFCQVMILPQGQFEKLLVARSDEKEAVLVSLFHAERWQQIAERLCAKANLMRQKIDAEQLSMKAALEGFGCADTEELAVRLAGVERALGEMRSAREALAKELSLRREALERAVQADRLFSEQKEKRAVVDTFEKNRPLYEEEARKLALALAAARLIPACERQNACREKACRCEAAAEEAAQELARAQAARDAAQERLSKLEISRPQNEQAKAELAKLSALRESYEKLEGAKAAAKQAQEFWEAADGAAREQQAALEEATRRRDGLAQERARLFEAFTAKLPALRETLAARERAREFLERRAAQMEQLARDEAESAALQAQRDACQCALEQAEAEYAACSRRYLDDAAGRLAQSLGEGAPCPVCGSPHHPAPHRSAENGPSRAALEKFGERVQAARRALADCEARFAGTAARLSQQREALFVLGREMEKLPPYDPKEHAAARQELENALEQDAERAALSQKLQMAEEALAKLAERSEPLRQALTQAVQQKERTAAQYQALLSQRDAAAGDLPGLCGRIETLSKNIAEFDQFYERAGHAHSQAAQELARAEEAARHLRAQAGETLKEQKAEQERLREMLENEGFSDVREVYEAAIPEPQRQARETHLRRERMQWEAAQGRLRELAGQLDGQEPPDLAAMRRDLKSRETEKETLDFKWGEQQQECERIAGTLATLEKRGKALVEKRAVYDRLSGFGKLLRGDSGVSLRRYVLGVMLSSITAEANRLLKNVHGGRYQLYRTLEGSGRSRKAGLDLEVLDAHAGKRRPAAGLSGGEKFLVSLSLALGLSAVVQSQSGGIRMDAMFIDEGFGSLDPGSIADALDVLASVRGSRRLVGIISHVAALRENIDASIEVVKERAGSRLVLHA